MPTASHPFDRALSRLGNDRELFQELIAYFREDAPGLVETIRSGTAAGCRDGVLRAAHSLRGLLANFDAETAVDIAGSIEQMARKDELHAVPGAIAELETEIDALRIALDGYMAESPSHLVRR
jgi:HPt (histidine-containing phosphotransfer) domain-containing protein